MAKGTINKVILLGNVGNIEIKKTEGGFVIANLSLATTEVSGSKSQGTAKEHTEWHKIVIFGKLAEITEQYVTKGSKIYIEGKHQTRKWQDKNGADHYSSEIVADEMQIVSSKPKEAIAQTLQPSSLTPLANPHVPFNDDIPF